MSKYILISFFLVFLGSCRQIETPSKDEMLDRELKSINWKQVDQFPSIAACDSIQDKELQKQCFFEYLAQAVQQRLSVDTFSILYPQLDTINVQVTVFPDSTVQFKPQFPKSEAVYDTIVIDSVIRTRLVDLPKINPAIKRGIPVKTQFILPVILKVE